MSGRCQSWPVLSHGERLHVMQTAILQITLTKAVTSGVFWVFDPPPPKFQGKIRHTKTDLLLVTKFSKVTLLHQWTVTKHTVHRRWKGSVMGGTMASAEHEPITVEPITAEPPAAEPLVRGAKPPPPEAESILVIGCQTEPANLASFQKISSTAGNEWSNCRFVGIA